MKKTIYTAINSAVLLVYLKKKSYFCNVFGFYDDLRLSTKLQFFGDIRKAFG